MKKTIYKSIYICYLIYDARWGINEIKILKISEWKMKKAIYKKPFFCYLIYDARWAKNEMQ